MGAEIMEKTKIENGITYELRGDIYYPCFTLPEQTNYTIGKYGDMRLDYIKKHRRGTYTTLLMDGNLNEHLYEVDQQAKEMVRTITADLAKSRGIDEQLKANDQLRWVAEMNGAKATAEEIVFKELIYA